MNDVSTTAAAQPAQTKTVKEHMTARRIFPDVASAVAYLGLCAESFSDWADTTFAAPGIDSEGNFDPAIYSADMDVMVSKLMRIGKKGEDSTVKAVVVAPVPKLSVILADESAKAWLEKIVHKELNHVAVRALREAEDVSTVIDQMPTTLAGYIESGRAGSGILESFNALYKQINATLSGPFPVWARYRLIKTELRKAMESKGYAQANYAALEDYRGKGIDSGLFVTAINLGVAAAKRKGLDPTIFERWLATRDQKVFDLAESEDDDAEFDLDSMTDSLLAEDAPEATESDEATSA